MLLYLTDTPSEYRDRDVGNCVMHTYSTEIPKYLQKMDTPYALVKSQKFIQYTNKVCPNILSDQRLKMYCKEKITHVLSYDNYLKSLYFNVFLLNIWKGAGDLAQVVECLCLTGTRFYSQHHIKSSVVSQACKSQHSENGDREIRSLKSFLATQRLRVAWGVWGEV